jgi:hypothetical protein
MRGKFSIRMSWLGILLGNIDKAHVILCFNKILQSLLISMSITYIPLNECGGRSSARPPSYTVQLTILVLMCACPQSLRKMCGTLIVTNHSTCYCQPFFTSLQSPFHRMLNHGNHSQEPTRWERLFLFDLKISFVDSASTWIFTFKVHKWNQLSVRTAESDHYFATLWLLGLKSWYQICITYIWVNLKM